MFQLRVLKMAGLFLAHKYSNTLMAGTRELMRTLGRMQLHTLEIHHMPLGSIAAELSGEEESWRRPRQLPLQRLVLLNCNLSSKATYEVLRACGKLRELSLASNWGYRVVGALADEGFGVGRDECGWMRLQPVELPKLEWLDVQGAKVTPAGVAHLPGKKLLWVWS
jgi:hypothetical protein